MIQEQGIQRVIVLGASSFVGKSVLDGLLEDGFKVLAFTRKLGSLSSSMCANTALEWVQLPENHIDVSQKNKIKYCICVAPIWTLPMHFKLLKSYGVQKVIALSSTSRYTKLMSSDKKERNIAQRLIDSERLLVQWAEARDVQWSILRPTLIYKPGQDENITAIARFIRQYGFFPLVGAAQGRRQPIHADDVAAYCLAALKSKEVSNKAFNITGGESLVYREMVKRIFRAMRRRPVMLTIPQVLFKIISRIVPRYQNWTVSMAERMNKDMVFDTSFADEKLNVSPRAFILQQDDFNSFLRSKN